MAHPDRVRLAAAALAFSTREKDYGGIHLAIDVADVGPLHRLLEAITGAAPGYAQLVALGGNARAVAEWIFPRGRFSALASLQLRRAEWVRISIEEDVGVLELTAAAARAAGELVASVHSSGGDVCIVGDSGSWNDRWWLWPR